MKTALAAIAIAIAALSGSALGSGVSSHAGVNDDHANWTGYGRTPGDSHYSPLDRVNDGNVAQLGLAWSYDLAPGNSVSAPVERNGTLYTSTGYSIVTAFDAATGKQLWRFDPDVPKTAGAKLRLGWGSRGLAVDGDKVFVGTQDGRLIALDAKTGSVVWSVLTTDKDDGRFITGVPRIAAGKVLIGHGGGDVGATRGYVTCYDATTGRQLWRFYTVPGDPAAGFEDPAQAIAAKSWASDSWKLGGGGVVWHAMTYDPELDRFYIGTGNAQPQNRTARSQGEGDNLFTASIIALDAKTGKYLWHYQVVPGDEWDYDATSDIQLATLTIDGKPRKVAMQAPKDGFFYVLDRTNGKLISAEPFAAVTWAKKIDLATGRPVEVEGARYHGREPFLLSPGHEGAHNWLPMAFSPKTRLVYLPTSEKPMLVGDKGINFEPDTAGANRTYLQAWDPVAQKAVWRVDTPGWFPAGAMATGGNLVFQGRIDHAFDAYSATTGKLLWTFDAKAPVIAPPITYQVNGVQYVTVLTGYGGSGGVFGQSLQKYNLDYRSMPRRVLTFALGGTVTLPPAPEAPTLTAPADSDFSADPARAMKGAGGYGMNCSLCHGQRAIAAGAAPDLRGSAIPLSSDAFKSVVHDGILLPRGMPKFDNLSPEQLENIRFYLRSRAQELPKP